MIPNLARWLELSRAVLGPEPVLFRAPGGFDRLVLGYGETRGRRSTLLVLMEHGDGTIYTDEIPRLAAAGWRARA